MGDSHRKAPALSRIFLIESFFCSFSGLGKRFLGGEVPPLFSRISPFLHGLFGVALALCSCFSAFLRLRACVGGCLSLFVGYPIGQSVIEEKGEGFENGKILLAHLV